MTSDKQLSVIKEHFRRQMTERASTVLRDAGISTPVGFVDGYVDAQLSAVERALFEHFDREFARPSSRVRDEMETFMLEIES